MSKPRRNGQTTTQADINQAVALAVFDKVPCGNGLYLLVDGKGHAYYRLKYSIS